MIIRANVDQILWVAIRVTSFFFLHRKRPLESRINSIYKNLSPAGCCSKDMITKVVQQADKVVEETGDINFDKLVDIVFEEIKEN